jgi:hypothetical protein
MVPRTQRKQHYLHIFAGTAAHSSLQYMDSTLTAGRGAFQNKLALGRNVLEENPGF